MEIFLRYIITIDDEIWSEIGIDSKGCANHAEDNFLLVEQSLMPLRQLSNCVLFHIYSSN